MRFHACYAPKREGSASPASSMLCGNMCRERQRGAVLQGTRGEAAAAAGASRESSGDVRSADRPTTERLAANPGRAAAVAAGSEAARRDTHNDLPPAMAPGWRGQ